MVRQFRIIVEKTSEGVNISFTKGSEAMATEVWFDSNLMHVRLQDGREISVPVEWFPKLKNASEEQRKQWRIIGEGTGIRWGNLGEDISIDALLKG